MSPRVGLSLSLCIREVILGQTPEEDILYIISNTATPESVTFSMLVSRYQRNYWSKDPQRAGELAWRLYNAGRIIQPRLLNPNYQHYITTAPPGPWIGARLT
jgi:hypothetical protein